MDYLNILFLFLVFVTNSSKKNHIEEAQKIFGEGYGREWMFFPDGDGNLHFISIFEPMGRDPLGGRKRLQKLPELKNDEV